nr:uncharacterized protein LOC111849034 isoform X4 [Paramormyrops kingsleyae]
MQTCISLKTQLSSILDIITKAAVTEISELISEAAEYASELHLEMTVSVNDGEAPGRKSTITPIDITTTQVASIMDRLSKDAADKIFRLVDENFASLRLEVSQSQNENESLRKRLQLMESESVTTQERPQEGGRGGSLRIHSCWLNSDLCQTVQVPRIRCTPWLCLFQNRSHYSPSALMKEDLQPRALMTLHCGVQLGWRRSVCGSGMWVS